MSERSEFDPRFDPAFQPGFDGVTTLVPHVASVPRVTLAPVDALSDQPHVDDSAQHHPAVEEPADGEPTRTNPFLIALGLVAIACVAGGVILLTRLRELAAELANANNYEYVLLQAFIIGSPILICLGLATGIGLLFTLALRWRR
jgi:hypothetical protein